MNVVQHRKGEFVKASSVPYGTIMKRPSGFFFIKTSMMVPGMQGAFYWASLGDGSCLAVPASETVEVVTGEVVIKTQF